MKKERIIDLLIEKYNLNEKEAKGLILSGNVLIDEHVITKIGLKIDNTKKIRIKNKRKYVSRGAYKLLGALEKLPISLNEKICVDIGSSTGGFTQVLLERGAAKIYAIDCGSNLLHYSLRKNSKVVIMENRRITDLTVADFDEKIDFAVMDVSFCSSVFLVQFIFENLDIKKILVLIKPQFEYNRLLSYIDLSRNFRGVVKKTEDITRIINYIEKEFKQKELIIYNIIPSSLKGQKGNQEYLFYMGLKE